MTRTAERPIETVPPARETAPTGRASARRLVVRTACIVVAEPRVGTRVADDLVPGSYTFVCTVSGHESMTGTLEVQ